MSNNQNNYEMVDNRPNNKSSKRWMVWTVSGLIVLGLGVGTYALTQSNDTIQKASSTQQGLKVKNTNSGQSATDNKDAVATGTESNQNASKSAENSSTEKQKEEAVDMTVVENGLKSLGSIVKFDVDSTALSKTIKDKIATVLSNIPQNSKLTLIGYTDASGTEDYNKKLGQLRAETVKNFIKEQNINLEVNVLSKGKSEPIGDNLTEEGRLKNRRVEFVLSSN